MRADADCFSSQTHTPTSVACFPEYATDGGCADLAQAVSSHGRETHLSMTFEIPGRGRQDRLQTLLTDEVHTLSDHQQSGFHMLFVRPTVLTLARPRRQASTRHPTDQMPIQTGD